MTVIDYKAAGVDVEAGNEAVRRIKTLAEKTFSPRVLTPIGGFGAIYDIKAAFAPYDHPVLVQSIDGVGTKIKVARMMGKFDTIGIDLVSATANDIVAMGATPLTLLDYLANDKLNPDVVEQIISGISQACLENGISLIGGETAEMPGTYLPGEYDLVGVVTGIVEKDQIISGASIVPGDVVLGLSSSGMHTNGYSLARKLFFEVAGLQVDSWHPELEATVGEILLAPHINYTKPVLKCLQNKLEIKGMAHITGGGFIHNIPRILPGNCAVEITQGTWPIAPLFDVLRHLGDLNLHSLYQTFNMGIGLVMIASPEMAEQLKESLASFAEFKVYEIGQVVASHQKEVRIL